MALLCLARWSCGAYGWLRYPFVGLISAAGCKRGVVEVVCGALVGTKVAYDPDKRFEGGERAASKLEM